MSCWDGNKYSIFVTKFSFHKIFCHNFFNQIQIFSFIHNYDFIICNVSSINIFVWLAAHHPPPTLCLSTKTQILVERDQNTNPVRHHFSIFGFVIAKIESHCQCCYHKIRFECLFLSISCVIVDY